MANRFLVRNMGGSGLFNGSDNYIDIGNLDTLGSKIGNGISISFWVLSQQLTAGTILGTRVSSTNNYLLIKLNSQNGSNNAGYIQVQFSDTGNKVTNGYAKIAQVNNGNWHHIVCTLKPSTNTITVYIDNAGQTPSYTTQTTPASFTNFTRHIFLGALNNNNVVATPYFKGLLADIFIYNAILTASEVADLYYRGSTDINSLAHYKFSEQSGTTIADSTGNGNTGTWNGTLGSEWSTSIPITVRTGV